MVGWLVGGLLRRYKFVLLVCRCLVPHCNFLVLRTTQKCLWLSNNDGWCHGMRAVNAATIAVVCVLVAAAVLSAVAVWQSYARVETKTTPSTLGEKQSNGSNVALPTFPGAIQAQFKDALPQVLVVARPAIGAWAPARISGTSSVTRVPLGSQWLQASTAELRWSQLSLDTYCNAWGTLQFSDTGWVMPLTPGSTAAVGTSDVTLPTLGVAGTVKTSAFLASLARAGYSSWMFTSILNRCALYAGTPSGVCLAWTWSPLVPDQNGWYVVKLQPSGDEPWTHAVIDVGRWLSLLPGAAASAEITSSYILRTTTGLTFPVPSGTYQTSAMSVRDDFVLPQGYCLLGVSILARNTAVGFDLKERRLGVSTIQVGNIGEPPQRFQFA